MMTTALLAKGRTATATTATTTTTTLLLTGIATKLQTNLALLKHLVSPRKCAQCGDDGGGGVGDDEVLLELQYPYLLSVAGDGVEREREGKRYKLGEGASI